MRNAVRLLSLFDAIRKAQKRFSPSQRGIRSMREPAKQAPSGARAHRACIAVNATDMVRAERRNAPGERRLRADSQTDSWRRTEMGTNHIACFGVWRRGARRQAERLNRTNTTRWHMPHRTDAVFTLAGAGKNEAAIEA